VNDDEPDDPVIAAAKRVDGGGSRSRQGAGSGDAENGGLRGTQAVD